MIRSMTAYARKERVSGLGSIAWELRSVNHRYLEITIRLPETLRPLEFPMRERVSKFLSRGKVDCSLRLQSDTGILTELSLNRTLAARLLEIERDLGNLMGTGARLSLGDVMGWPGVVNQAEPDLEQIQTEMLSCLDQALADLVAARQREGSRIAETLRTRCAAVEHQVQKVRARRPQVLLKLREKLMARLSELPLEADPARLEQELVIIAQRMDVEEELDRLDSHLVEVQQVLGRQEPVGRRFDFLMQEMNREANTLASKSGDTDTTKAAVELKVLIEQMREQVQNIE